MNRPANLLPAERRVATGGDRSLPPSDQGLIREFIQALAEEIEVIKKGRGGSAITVYDGSFIRREGPLFVYVFTTESPLIVMDDAPAEVEVGGQRFAGQIISVQGSEVAVGVEHDFGKSIAEARLITNLWYLLEALRKRYEEILNGQRSLDTRLGNGILGLVPATTRVDGGELILPPSKDPPNDEQLAAIRAVCGSDVHFIWGPPGTGKTQTIGFLIAALLRRNLRVLVVSHTNVATDHAIANAAKLLLDTDDYQSGKLVRYGNISPNSGLLDNPELEMVIPDKIAERLGQDLNHQLAKLQAELEPIQPALSSLREIETLLAGQKEAVRKLGELEVNLRRCAEEQVNAKSREKSLTTQLQAAKDKLAEAQAAGRLKRFFLGFDPVKLQVQVTKAETELAVVRRRIAAGPAKLDEFRAAVGRAQADEARCGAESQAMLSCRGLDAEDLSARIAQLCKRAEELTAAIRAIEAEFEAIVAKILREAKVIATSLTKATIAKQMDDQKFDVVVVDEASMAPMPSLYFAAGRAAQKAVVVGDFRQLPPICQAEKDNKQLAIKWLGRDIFNQAGIQRAVDDRQPEPRLTMLRRQYRMHPEISRLSNAIIYSGELVDCLSREVLRNITSFLKKSPFAASPLVLYDVSSTNPWSSRLDQGGRYNLYSAVLSAELARRAANAGVESIGVISPYRLQARLIKMMLDDSGDTKLRHLKVCNVHRVQGVEQDLIIYDVAEGPPVDPWFAKDHGLNSDAAKLINVAITRPKAQLVIVANADFLASRLRPDSILLRVLEEVRQRGTVVDSQEVLNDYFCSEFDRWASLLDPHDASIDPDNSTPYTERNFYGAFFADLRRAVREIIIVSPFLTASRAQQFFNLFRSKVAEGIEVRVFTRMLREQQGDMFQQAEIVFEELKRIGVQVVERRGLHQKFAFLDRKIVWEGSLNILSRPERTPSNPEEHMRRIGDWDTPATRTCEGLIELHKFGNDSEIDPGTRGPIQTDRKCKCGSPKVLVRGPHSIFLGCMDYPGCQECKPEFIRRGERILTDAICPGKDGVPCGKPMVAMQGKFGVYLRGSCPNCTMTRDIKW